MECPKCKYVFFTDEEDYLFCPNCCKPVEENSSLGIVPEFYEKLKLFQRRNEKSYWMVIGFAFAVIIEGLIGKLYFDSIFLNSIPGIRFDYDSFCHMILFMICMAISNAFGCDGVVCSYWKKYLKERVLFFKSDWFLWVKTTCYVLVLLWALYFFVPYYTESRHVRWEAEKTYSEEYIAETYVNFSRWFSVQMILQFLVMVSYEWIYFFKHRRACEYNEELLEEDTDRAEVREKLEDCLKEMFSSGEKEGNSFKDEEKYD